MTQVMPDVVDWLRAQRDEHAQKRDQAFSTDDWHAGNPHDDQARNLYLAIQEIERLRVITTVLKDVLARRVVEGWRSEKETP
jgi:hypothetical protein